MGVTDLAHCKDPAFITQGLQQLEKGNREV